MNCSIAELRDKQVVCIKDGTILGYVCDVEVDIHNGCLVSIIIFTKKGMFSGIGKNDDIIIPWSNIEVIGQDTILVNWELPQVVRKQTRDLLKFKIFNN
ncbi:MAG: YlmC/YmxH family sporulation protein [Clostridia bacterium]|nr:YlmC/YmxH family sporulation protein [Clostridia bacterium]